ncbi:MAG TPA: M1 family metallopeptidase, partial [Chitinophagaceae bacterium]|nr:M1 family metallopeptidase [Chitinophagaceae bacterium]
MKSVLVSFLCFLLLSVSPLLSTAQHVSKSDPGSYRSTFDRVNNLVHTKLNARFDYSKSYLLGEVWLTLKPHFYATDSLLLDAKGMEIKEVALVKGGRNVRLKYDYDGLLLNINLDKVYSNKESYTIYINYVAKPDEFQSKGSAAITDAKGLYFINPKGEDKNKPTQIWTQGETEGTSVYVPTIDKPNQKTTQEFSLTVPAKYVSLSNGKLVSQKVNGDGTRTDNWKMDLPHAPYLFFIGVGDFAVVKDSYKGKEVSYYVEKEYAPVARKIFGYTPEMMQFFAKVTGVEYPWNKYAQIVGRDYVSGAMENTTATLHQESAQQDARELTDGNKWENVIAHELFHQWFGDYVTTESWSNLTLNESFANYSEYLWNEYKYGKDAADAHNFKEMEGYILSGSEKKNLVRFHYGDKEEMFDAVSYNKGGRILHMLRNYVGDSAFFKSINLYLTANKFKAAEAHHLRLAFEEVTGKDLNWFWNQWYFGAGHPKLDINYSYDAVKKQVQVITRQTQADSNLFQLPLALDIVLNSGRTRHNIMLQNRVDTFVFSSTTKPSFINVDADKTLLAEKTENKTMDEYLAQYTAGRTYLDRKEAIDAAALKQEEQKAVDILLLGLKDKYHGLQTYTLEKLDLDKKDLKTLAEESIAKLARESNVRSVKAAAIKRLEEYRFAKYIPLFQSALTDSSYTVAGNALEALRKVDSTIAYREAKKLISTNPKGALAKAIGSVMMLFNDESAS